MSLGFQTISYTPHEDCALQLELLLVSFSILLLIN
jgi:hypothetical protein